MSRKFHLVASLAAACALAASLPAGPANATIATITYSGFAALSHDDLGLFGASGSNFDGRQVSLVLTLDTSKGLKFGNCSAGYCYLEDVGGSNVGFPSPLDAKLTIAGVSKTLSGSLGAADGVTTGPNPFGFCANPASCSFLMQAIEDSPSDQVSVTVETTGALQFPLSLTTPFDVAIDYQQVFAGGQFSFSDGTNDGLTTGAEFAFRDVRLTLPSAAPEPSGWAMLLVGFSGIGTALRSGGRRLRQSTPYLAL